MKKSPKSVPPSPLKKVPYPPDLKELIDDYRRFANDHDAVMESWIPHYRRSRFAEQEMLRAAAKYGPIDDLVPQAVGSAFGNAREIQVLGIYDVLAHIAPEASTYADALRAQVRNAVLPSRNRVRAAPIRHFADVPSNVSDAELISGFHNQWREEA